MGVAEVHPALIIRPTVARPATALGTAMGMAVGTGREEYGSECQAFLAHHITADGLRSPRNKLHPHPHRSLHFP